MQFTSHDHAIFMTIEAIRTKRKEQDEVITLLITGQEIQKLHEVRRRCIKV